MSTQWWLEAEAGREMVRSRSDAANWPDEPEADDDDEDRCPECCWLGGEHSEDCPTLKHDDEEAER